MATDKDIERAEIIVKLMQDMETMLCRTWCERDKCLACQAQMAEIARKAVEAKYGEA